MARQIVAGIDIGTSEIKVVITEGLIDSGHITPKIIGIGSSSSKGVYRGYVNNPAEVASSIALAVHKAEKIAKIKIRRAYISFGGIGLTSLTSRGSVIISRADLEITERDISLALEAAETSIPPALSINRRIINTIPIEYKIDGETVWGQALGLKAQKLEVKALFLTCLEHHLANLITAVEDAGIEVIDIVASPVALSFVTLSKKQKRVGCLLVDIGAETFSTVVFENNNLVSLAVFPVGSNDLTNNIALGLKVPLEEAENIKIGDDRGISYHKKKLDEIVTTWLKDCFGLVETHLKSIGRNALLPAGVILSGGGATITGIKNIAENSLQLPAQMSEIHFGASAENSIKDRAWAVACGLSVVGLNTDDQKHSIGIRNNALLGGNGKNLGKTISRWVSQFLP